MRKILTYLVIFLSLVSICVLLLVFARQLPQDRIESHFMESTDQFLIEQNYGRIVNNAQSRYAFDNVSEAMILYHSVYLNNYEPLTSIFSNATYYSPDDATMDDFIESYRTAVIAHTPSNGPYVRYWQGFRLPVRILLTFFNYTEIRELLMWGFILLFCLALLTLYRQTHSFWPPMMLALCIALSNPIMLCSSLQFSCCFLLAFAGIIGLPYIVKRPTFVGYYFFVLGALTQYFDFYTAPFITCGLPLIGLLLCLIYQGEVSARKLLKLTARCVSLWFCTYIGMWLAKLALTTLFTDINGIADGLASFLSRVGIEKSEALAQYYSPIGALLSCLKAMLGIKPWIALIGAWLISFVVILARKQIKKHFALAGIFVLISLIPVVWIMLAAQPSFIHSFFQYRVLCIPVLGMFCSLLALGQAAPVLQNNIQENSINSNEIASGS